MPYERRIAAFMRRHTDSKGRMHRTVAAGALILAGCLFGGALGALDLQRYPAAAPKPLTTVQPLTQIKQIPLPDLAVTSLSCTQAIADQGNPVKVTVTVRNVGTAGTPSSGYTPTTSYYLSTDAAAGNDVPLGSSPLRSLAAGAEMTETFSFKLNSSTPCGSFYILACTDTYNQVMEANEQNNCTATATKVEIKLPDLAVTSFSTTATRVKLGGQITVTDTTGVIGNVDLKVTYSMVNPKDVPDSNQNPANNIPFNTGYYLSRDNVLSNSDLFIGWRTLVAYMKAGASNTATTNLTIPPTTQNGTYYLIACTGRPGVILECNTGNNWIVAAQPLVVELAQ